MTSSLNKLFSVFFLLLLLASVFSAGCIDINDINIFDDDDDDEDDKKEKKEKDESPIVVFEPSKWQAEVGTTIVFNASATEARNGNISYYQWNFGDNVNEDGEDVIEVSHSYAAGGTYNVSLTVLDSNNMTNTSWLFIGVYEQLSDSGRVSSSFLLGPDSEDHEHQVSNDTMWVFYHIELDNPFEDPRTANCTMTLTIADVEYWNETMDVTNADPETLEFNVTVHVENPSGGGNESENWTHHIGRYVFTITADSGTVDWDLMIMKGYSYGKPEE